MALRQLKIDNVPLITILPEDERSIVDIKARGFFSVLHRASIATVLSDLQEGRNAAVLISLRAKITSYTIDDIMHISKMFPGIRLMAFISNLADINHSLMLQLGDAGVKVAIKSESNDDWFFLRNILTKIGDEHIRITASRKVSKDLKYTPKDCKKFFSILFEHASQVSNIKELCSHLGTNASTLNTRFARMGLPSPKECLIYARLVRMAYALEQKGVLAGRAAIRLRYSSPQMFQRHLKDVMGIGSQRFRLEYNGEKMLDLFRKRFIFPYIRILKQFHPLKPERRQYKPRTR